MISHPLIDEYIELAESGKIKVNKERSLLFKIIKEKIYPRDDLYFDNDLIEKYIQFTEKNFFPLAKYQKFITPFIFLFRKEDGEPQFDEILLTLARGGGKNGFMSSRDAFFISPLYPVRDYDVTITANSEKQGKVSFEEVYETVQRRGLEDHYYLTKMSITGRGNNSVFSYRTNNPKTMDSARDGCLEFDEIHQFENDSAVKIQRSGLGKIAHARTFYNGTNGHVREGFYDKLIEKSMKILNGELDEFRLFPFICKLDDPEEVDDMSNWPKANPMLDETTPYAKRLLARTKADYDDLELEPSGRQEFMTKRMNLPEADIEKDVTTREKLMAALRSPGIDLSGRSCVAGFDYASIRDFASVGLLFKNGDEFIWKQHSFARKQFLDMFKIKAPIREWQEQVYDDTFTAVTCQGYTFQKSFKMNEVIFLQYNNNRLQEYFTQLFNDYEKLHTRLVEALARNNQIRGVLSTRTNASFDDKKREKMQRYADGLFKSFTTKTVAIVPAQEGMEYSELTNTTGTSNISVDELKKLRRQFDDEVADILGIPTALMHGDMANLENSQKMFNSYCYQSLVKKMSDGLNFALLSKSEHRGNKRLVIVGEGQRDKFSLAQSIDKLISSGSMLINEVREELGLEAVPWGDKPLITKNYQLGEDVEKGGEKEDESDSD